MFINTKHAKLPSKVCSASKGMYQKRTVPYFIFPSTFVCTSSFLPFGALLTDRQRNFFTPALFPKSSFFPLSARHGALPTHRRNSTGLAELWGGWPIERESRYQSQRDKTKTTLETSRSRRHRDETVACPEVKWVLTPLSRESQVK